MEPIEQRIRSVLDFCKIFASHLAVDVVPINDIYGPTATVPSINAIVVSEESLQGGRAVNEKRRENGLNPLYIYVIDVISGVVSDGKLGSTNLRQLVAERNGLK